jgi:hypothetical protein
MIIRIVISLALAGSVGACGYQADEPERDADTRAGTAANTTAGEGRATDGEPRTTGITQQADPTPPANPTGRGVQAGTGRGRGEAPEAVEGHGGSSQVTEAEAVSDCQDLQEPERAECIRRVRAGYDITGDQEDRTTPRQDAMERDDR